MNKVFTSGSPAEVDALYKKYGACKISKVPSELDKAYFVMALASDYMSTVQYNSGSAIADQCEKTLRETEGEPISGCQDVSYKSLVKGLSEDQSSTSDNSRQWIYQTCTQFGYFQTCETNENGKCLFAPQMNLDYYTNLCRDVFGFASYEVNKRIQFSNDYYGGNYTQGSRILFVNGEIDPWHALSVQKDLQDDQTSILIPDGSHCQNMYSSSSEDSEFMKKAKSKIEAKVAEWLRNPTFVIE
jgi:serine protease 16